jgi:biopolymer transport protein ExbD
MARLLRASEQVFGPEDPEFQIAPMVDVLLVILLFFVSITSAETMRAHPQNLAGLELPLARDSRAKETTAGQVVINAAWINGAGMLEVAEVSTSAFADPDRLRPFLRSAAQADPNLRALIRADRKVEYGFINQIMLVCTQEGIANITFAVVDKERTQS